MQVLDRLRVGGHIVAQDEQLARHSARISPAVSRRKVVLPAPSGSHQRGATAPSRTLSVMPSSARTGCGAVLTAKYLPTSRASMAKPSPFMAVRLPGVRAVAVHDRPPPACGQLLFFTTFPFRVRTDIDRHGRRHAQAHAVVGVFHQYAHFVDQAGAQGFGLYVFGREFRDGRDVAHLAIDRLAGIAVRADLRAMPSLTRPRSVSLM